MNTLALVFCLVAASVSAENIPELAEKLGATELVTLVKEAGLAGALSGPGPFTVFGPTNESFGKLPAAVVEKLKRHKQLLVDVLKYHVISGSVYSTQLSNEMTAPSLLMLQNKPVDIRINIYNNGQLITAEGSPVVMPNQNASNGVIHVVDRVLFPIPIGNIPEVVTAEKARFSTLLTAVEKANLVQTLAGGPFTLFAPTNAAFAKIPAADLEKLLANTTALARVLTYHVVSGTYWSSSLSNNMMPKTVEGQTITITIEGGGVKINGNSKVEEADLAVSNGVIHVIDTVLLPPMEELGIY